MSTGDSWNVLTRPNDRAFAAFLEEMEPLTTVMSDKYRSRYLDPKLRRGGRFYRHDSNSAIYHGPGGFFYPVGITAGVPEPEQLRRRIGSFLRLYSIMGNRQDVENLGALFTVKPRIAVDYLLLHYSGPALPPPPPPPDREITLFSPGEADWKELLPLQTAYEAEEVRLPGHEGSIAASKANLLDSLRSQRVLVALFRGTPICRVATNARGYQNDQIGGVYTVPVWRRRGIASWLMHHLVHSLAAEGKETSLFVKTGNTAARSLYQQMGFSFVSDFRISYYV